MKLIYCATPSRLAEKKSEIMDFVTKQGLGPLHPFQAFPYEKFEGGGMSREKVMEFCLRAVGICDELWMFGVSRGTLMELRHALQLQKPIRLFLDGFDLDWRGEYEKLKSEYNDPLKGLAGA